MLAQSPVRARCERCVRGCEERKRLAADAAAALLWISLSAGVILFNKHILARAGFPFPITLTLWHQLFCAALAAALVRGGAVPPCPTMDAATYVRAVAPVGALFAGTLWFGNAAYVTLSVSFIQMLKALMPAAVFGVGCALGTEAFKWGTVANMAVVTGGVALASVGEVALVPAGVAAQLASIATESVRLTLVQVLLQGRGLRLNPVTSMYYVAPVSALCLLPPWLALEAADLRAGLASGDVAISPAVLVANAAAAAALNLAVFLLVGRTSALTMNVAGVVKDWLLIGLSAALFGSPVTALNLAGYGVAFCGVVWYNWGKWTAALAPFPPPADAKEGELVPLQAGGGGERKGGAAVARSPSRGEGMIKAGT